MMSKKNKEIPSNTRRATLRSQVSSLRGIPDDFHQPEIVVPPDGGWGWVVVCAGFFCSFIMDGSLYTYGIFIDDISEAFNISTTQASLANSLMSGFYFMMGPLICALINRLGFRFVGIMGGLLASIVYMVCSEITNFYLFTTIFGVFGGLALGMIYVPTNIVIGFYFERWRAMAMSIAVCGSSVGILSFKPVIKGMLSAYDWRADFKLLSACFFFCALCALTYRPVKTVKIILGDQKMQHFDSFSTFNISEENRIRSFYQRYHNVLYPTTSEFYDQAAASGRISISQDSFLLLANPSDSISNATTHRTISNITRCDICKRCCTRTRNCMKGNCDFMKNLITSTRPMYRDDVFYVQSFFTLPEYNRSFAAPSRGAPGRASISTTVDYHLSVTRAMSLRDKAEEEYFCICCPESVKRTLVTMLDFRLLKSPSFTLIALSGFFTVLGLYPPFIYMSKRALAKHLDPEGTFYLLSIIGISNLVGRIMCGVVASFPKIDSTTFSCLMLIICGLMTTVSVYINTITGQFVVAGIFGFTIACLPSLRGVIMVEMFGLEKLTNSFGIMMLFQGIASFMSLPLASVIYEAYNSYDMAFLFSGANILVSGVMLIPTKRILRWEKKRGEN